MKRFLWSLAVLSFLGFLGTVACREIKNDSGGDPSSQPASQAASQPSP